MYAYVFINHERWKGMYAHVHTQKKHVCTCICKPCFMKKACEYVYKTMLFEKVCTHMCLLNHPCEKKMYVHILINHPL